LKGLDANDAGEVRTLAGRRIPLVSVHDGEPGLLDNIGSIVGVRHESLAVRKHSRCGRPSDVYRYHHIDADSVVEACGKVLSETALENTVMPGENNGAHANGGQWQELWPAVSGKSSQHN
jgi:pyruvate dehydrogenase E1 component